MTAIDDRTVGCVVGIDVRIADEETRDFFDGTLSGRQADARQFRVSSFEFRISKI